jgi:RNA polymerase sigma-70 factor (ECF subfamily)
LSNSDKNPENWLNDHGDYLMNFAVKKTSDRELSVDLVQDTLLSGIESISKFRGESAVRTWLTSILNRKIIDHWRKKSTQTTATFSTYYNDDNDHWLENKGPNGRVAEIEEDIENEELGNTLQSCIQKLPENWRSIVIDKVVYEKDTDSVCKEHDITSSNLWVIIHRAKLQLKDCLEINWLK